MFPLLFTWGQASSNDTGLKSLSCPGAEPIKVQTDKQIFDIIIYIRSHVDFNVWDFYHKKKIDWKK